MLQNSETFSFSALARLREALAPSAADQCARFVLLHLHHRHPRQWLSSPRNAVAPGGGLLPVLEDLEVALSRKQAMRVATMSSLSDLYRAFYFRGVGLDSHEGMVGWLEQRYPLHLRRDIPTPDEMLDIQCMGERYVSLLLEDAAQFTSYGRHADACAFTLHDFEHAHKFFGDPESHRGQVQFFRRLRATLPMFKRWSDDTAFNRDLEYLKSDMNSHPVHLIKYLKAVVLSAEMRRTGTRWPELNGFWTEIFTDWQMQPRVTESALKINHPELEQAHDLIAVSQFFTCEPVAAGAR